MWKRVLIGLVVFLGFGPSAHALVVDSNIVSVTRLDVNSCAIQIDTSGTLSEIFSTDEIKIDGNLLVTLAGLLNLNLSTVDHILIASPSFEATAHVHADISIDDVDCSALQASATLELVAKGLTVLDSLTLTSNFGDMTSLTVDANGNLELIDLNTQSTPVTNAQGDTTNVGDTSSGGTVAGQGSGTDTGNGGNNNGTTVGALPNSASGEGCSLNPISNAPYSLITMFAMAACAITWNGLLRRKARRSK